MQADEEQDREGHRVAKVAEEAIRWNGAEEPLVVVQPDEGEVRLQVNPTW